MTKQTQKQVERERNKLIGIHKGSQIMLQRLRRNRKLANNPNISGEYKIKNDLREGKIARGGLQLLHAKVALARGLEREGKYQEAKDVFYEVHSMVAHTRPRASGGTVENISESQPPGNIQNLGLLYKVLGESQIELGKKLEDDSLIWNGETDYSIGENYCGNRTSKYFNKYGPRKQIKRGPKSGLKKSTYTIRERS